MSSTIRPSHERRQSAWTRGARAFGLSAAALAAAALMAAACGLPSYGFDDPLPPICTNLELDALESDLDCGGPCAPCDVGKRCRTGADCGSAACDALGVCAAPTCEDDRRNGDETDTDCGGPSCDACLPGGRCLEARDCAGSCVGGACVADCPAGTAECDGLRETECEARLKIDADNCGECGNLCSLPRAVSICSAGVCAVSECLAPFADCDGQAENGCEVNTASNAEHCGECGQACVALGGTPRCQNATCGIQCEAGYGDCDGNAANGCERDLTKDVKNCGECGAVCDAGNGTPWCDDGVCGISNCPPGFGDCNANSADGCETDLTRDLRNCNDCGTLCAAANGTATCTDSACVIDACKAGFEDCNSGTAAGYADGCETDIDNDADNCGSCNRTCAIANASARCEAGSCTLSSCTAPYADCDGDGLDCEVNTETNAQHCGGCGANGLDCNAVWSVRHGSGHCADSTCVFDACVGNFRDCNANTTLDGCETDISTSAQHCGACGQACAAPHGTNSCRAGVCTPVCGTLYGNCDGNLRNGCESVFASDAANCGACGVVCQQQNAVNACQAGSCNPTCSAGFLDCNQDPTDGCETDGRNNKAHCGGCNLACQDNHTTANPCQSGVCAPTCAAGYSDCDTSKANGCETLATTCGGGPGGGCSVPNSVLCDDFEDGDATGWTSSSGTWSIVTDGSRAYQSPVGSSLATAQSSWGDQSVQARVKVLAFGSGGSSYRVGVVARYSGSTNYYALGLDGAFDLRILRGTSAPSGATGTCTQLPTGLSVGTWFTLRLQVSGASGGVRLRSYVNGALFHDCTHTSSTVGGGTAGFSSYGSNTRGVFDDLVVTTP